MKQKHNQPTKIVNRRARFDYELGDSLVVGIVLSGKETKALRTGHGQLRGAYVTIKDGELWLLNATITSTPHFMIPEEEQVRTRKLLAKSREIKALINAREQGRTIVPLEFLTGGRHIKLKIAVGKGKRRFDKRETIKQRDLSRDTASRLKH